MKKRITAVILMVFMSIIMTVPAFAYEERVFDEAGLLTEDEIAQLNEKIEYIRSTYFCDVVVVTTNDSEGKSAMAFADDYYDYNDFGFGDEHDGIIFSLNMDIREYWMSTCGQAILWFSDSEIEDMKSTIQSDLSNGDYFNGFMAWLGDVEYYLETDDGSGYVIESPFALALYSIPQGLLVGLVLAVIIIIILIKMCKTAIPPTLASDYLDKNHVTLRRRDDIFLRTHTTSVKIQTESSGGSGHSGGGSSTHRSSSGRSHGGGGGKF